MKANNTAEVDKEQVNVKGTVLKVEPLDENWDIDLKYFCKPCEKIFNFSDFHEHIKSHDDSKVECEMNSRKDRKKPIRCDVCEKTFALKSSLTNHQKTHALQDIFNCKICDKVCLSKISLLNHERMHKPKDKYVCETCSKPFYDKHQLTKHQIVHSSSRPFECKTCRTGFKDKHGLSRHMITHASEKSFKCETCDKDFKRKGNLIHHQKTQLI